MTSIFHFFIPSFVIGVFTILGTHVLSHNSRRKISWVFASFCLLVASYFLTNLYLISTAYSTQDNTPFALRWRWVTASFMPAVFLHLVSYYFPTSWKRITKYWVGINYGSGIFFAFMALAFPQLIANPDFHSQDEVSIISTIPVLLDYIFLIPLGSSLLGGIAGLLQAHKKATLPTLRRQIVYVLYSILLFIFACSVYTAIMFTRTIPDLLRHFGDILIIISGFMLAKSVTDYGSFIGRPLEQRELWLSTVTITLVLIISLALLKVDQALAPASAYTYPTITGIFLFAVLSLAPNGFPWFKRELEKLFPYRANQHQELIKAHLEKTLSATNPQQIQTDLLQLLCNTLETYGGYIADHSSDLPDGVLSVQAKYGETQVVPGDPVNKPSLNSEHTQLVTALKETEQIAFIQERVELICPIKIENLFDGLIALREKKDGSSYTSAEISLCDTLINQVETTYRMIHSNGHHKQTTVSPVNSLHQIEQGVISTLNDFLTEHTNFRTPLLISVLGPMIVFQDGVLISESDWGSGRTKEMLAYLLWKGEEGATREAISDALWPGRSLEETANVFHVTLHRLRRALEPDLKQLRDSQYILHENGKYNFNAHAPYELDTTVFEKLVKSDHPETLIEALSLYRGSYMEDTLWALPASVEIERRSYEVMCINALKRLIPQLDPISAEPYRLRLRALDSYDEF